MDHLFAVRVRLCALAALVLCVGPVWGATHRVAPGGDLQAALAAAQPGDEILLTSGATYVGNFNLPAKPGTTFITLRTDAPGLPGAGVRTSPAYAPVLAKLRSPNTAPALTTAEGAHHWRIENVEFQANANGAGDIIVVGSSAYTQQSQMPNAIVFDRVYVHGDPAVGQKRGIALNGGATDILNSYISDIKSVGQDSQAIAGWNGSGPFLIQNNYLEGAGENVLFGGADPAVRDLVPSDITIRGNLFTKPIGWRREKWQVKNAFELKNARRVLVEGNVFENVWEAAQAGFAILFSTRNQDGRSPWSVIEDVTFQNNVIRHAAGAINISGYDDKYPSQQAKRIRIANNLVYDIDNTRWGGAGIFLQVGNEPRDIVVEHNTVLHTGNVVTVYGERAGVATPVRGFVFRNNFMRHNEYGVKGTGVATGQATMAVFFTDLVFDRNVLAGGDPARYPAGNFFPSVAEFESLFTNAALEDFTIRAGSQYRSAASDGGAVGADIASINNALRGNAGGTSAAGTNGDRRAVCRTGRTCN